MKAKYRPWVHAISADTGQGRHDSGKQSLINNLMPNDRFANPGFHPNWLAPLAFPLSSLIIQGWRKYLLEQ